MTDNKNRAELPTPNSTHSYWHRDPSKILLNHRTTEHLPSTADVVVVGSGISGTFAARELVEAGGRDVLLLEAREACWGATGRNGGHCQPAIWNSSAETARFELSTFNLVNDLVTKNAVPCDWHVVGGMHPIYSPTILAAAKKQIARLQRHADLRDKAYLVGEEGEGEVEFAPEAIGAVFQPFAAKLWPYKLVAWILEKLILEGGGKRERERGWFNLQTNTPVTGLDKDKDGDWTVSTPRGIVRAKQVLLATNAYTSYLLPGLTDIIVPVRGQVCALQPPEGSVQLPHSYVWTTETGGDQYLVHRGPEDEGTQVGNPIADRSLILGGERHVVPAGEEGISRDDEVNPDISVALHRSLAGALKLLPADRPEHETLRSTYEWTGIMGYSRDAQPWVGSVPSALLPETDTDGLWVCAGFTGHGMPVAPRCGVAVAEMMLGKEGGVELPEAWKPSEERMATVRDMLLPKSLEEFVLSLPAE
ncbi:FAD dependent oxidoreductase [Poronia punctata]|nr:FAD dependent oxidoreductase [Poronia punctata]